MLIYINIVSLILGIIASLIAWYIVSIHLRPKMDISSVIVRNGDDGNKYVFKIINKRGGKINDIKLHSTINIKGLDKKNPNRMTHLAIPIGSNQNSHILFLPTKNNSNSKDYMIPIYVDDIWAAISKNLPIDIIQPLEKKMNDSQLSLEDIMDINGNAEIDIIVSGYHCTSGTKRYIDVTYKKENIKKNGRFENNSIEYKEDNCSTS